MIEEKQDYLRSEILEKGYDGETFAGFLAEKKGQVDLEAFTFEELKYVTL